MDTKVLRKVRQGNGKKQLICFPYLGGYASAFTDVIQGLEDDIEVWVVNPPGHGGCSIPLKENIDSLISFYYSQIKEIIKPECLFFGHSMGGVVAYFLVQKILECKEVETSHIQLAISASGIPSEFENKSYSTLSDEDLIAHVVSYGGMPDEILAEKSLLDFLVPVFRADFKVLETAAVHLFEKMDVPAYIIWGNQDNIVSLQAALQWSEYFKREIKLIIIGEGDHMFLHSQAPVVADHLMKILVMM
ncbi:thioesterase II family protein [Anaeromicropila populeti]|uniref:External thioesterase TEII n=1 Tax=Anaeromicropila populeti TaxID=37658 RepID=A0A1I6LGV2_9FIRM|nr:alpha/beta fold hydrolase [Anaeromicropila populeti]SFS02550.1 external thioesterase TEII [Anaeromicropila populeti]